MWPGYDNQTYGYATNLKDCNKSRCRTNNTNNRGTAKYVDNSPHIRRPRPGVYNLGDRLPSSYSIRPIPPAPRGEQRVIKKQYDDEELPGEYDIGAIAGDFRVHNEKDPKHYHQI